ncbi:MAG: kinase/pyrophosphorylase [Gammaproteobacteria bacterium]|nr:kinase/pyrophosphorylase [Gammaproteobacteria bacterium]MCH9763921.1 kinase/pyrophosphorylase [Gammaproteobacteria bacterium]
MKRFAFMISDGTGLTVESLGNSLLSQFEDVSFEKETMPYIDSIEKAKGALEKINACAGDSKPIVFVTLIDSEISDYFKQANPCVLDLFGTFLSPLEKELGEKSSYTVGKTHALADIKTYDHRINAINYALDHDDGIKLKGYQDADVILVGVSRSGKTPCCLYMALQFGVFAANYPFTDEDLRCTELPKALRPYRKKLFGLTIDCDRLENIRSARRPNSQYASPTQCSAEIRQIEKLYIDERISYLNSTHYSIEEISTKIMAKTKIQRRL